MNLQYSCYSTPVTVLLLQYSCYSTPVTVLLLQYSCYSTPAQLDVDMSYKIGFNCCEN